MARLTECYYISLHPKCLELSLNDCNIPSFSSAIFISFPSYSEKGVTRDTIKISKYSHALHSSGCLKGNARPLSIAAILISVSLSSVHFVS